MKHVLKMKSNAREARFINFDDPCFNSSHLSAYRLKLNDMYCIKYTRRALHFSFSFLQFDELMLCVKSISAKRIFLVRHFLSAIFISPRRTKNIWLSFSNRRYNFPRKVEITGNFEYLKISRKMKK